MDGGAESDFRRRLLSVDCEMPETWAIKTET